MHILNQYLNLYNELRDLEMPFLERLIIISYDLELQINDTVYKFWCKISGYKFERRDKENPNACIVITKTGFHPLSNLFAEVFTRWTFFRTGRRHHWSNSPFSFEVYELDCPEQIPDGYRFGVYYKKNIDNCHYCGRCLDIRKSDKKITGKF